MNKSQSIVLWSLILVGLAVIALVMLAIFKPGTVNLSDLKEPVSETDWIRGDKNASVKIVEYSDFECPACAYYEENMLKQIEQSYGNKLAIVYRHYPLPQHKNAKLAAQTAEAAGKQGKFWEMHDMLFKLQQEWSTSPDAMQNFLAYAQMIKLDMVKFNQDLNSQEVIAKVQKNVDMGTAQNIQGTPSFFVNGKYIENPKTIDDFKKIIDNALSKAAK